jgi:hypothetical protein
MIKRTEAKASLRRRGFYDNEKPSKARSDEGNLCTSSGNVFSQTE